MSGNLATTYSRPTSATFGRLYSGSERTALWQSEQSKLQESPAEGSGDCIIFIISPETGKNEYTPYQVGGVDQKVLTNLKVNCMYVPSEEIQPLMSLEFNYNPADFKSLDASVTGKSFQDLISIIQLIDPVGTTGLFTGEINSPEFINKLETYANLVTTDPLQKQRVTLFSVCVNLLPELVGKIARMIDKPKPIYAGGKIDVRNPIDRLKGEISFGQHRQANIKEIINQVLKPEPGTTRKNAADFLHSLIKEQEKIIEGVQEGNISTVVFDKTLNNLQSGLTSFLKHIDEERLENIIEDRLHLISNLTRTALPVLLTQYKESKAEALASISKVNLNLNQAPDRKIFMDILYLCALDTILDARFLEPNMTYASSTLTWNRKYDFSLEIIVMPGGSYNIRIAYEIRHSDETARAYTGFLTRDSPVFEADLFELVQNRFVEMEKALTGPFAGLAEQTIELANMRFTRNIRIARPPVYRPATRRARPATAAPAARRPPGPGPAGPEP